MLQFSRAGMISIIAVILASIVVVLPNFFPEDTVAGWPSFMPKNKLVLGLDLQGGVYLKYEVDREDYVAGRLRDLQADVRDVLRENPRINFSGIGSQGNVVQVLILDLDRLADVRARLEPLRNPLTTSIIGTGSNFEFDLTISADGLVRFTYNEVALEQRVLQIVQQSIEVIGRRIDALGTVEPNIQREGGSRLLVEVPGLDDPERLKEIVGRTAQMTFHLVRGTVATGTTATDNSIVVVSAETPGLSYLLDPSALIRGEQIVDAQTTFDTNTNEPIVSFRLNTSGARAFGQVTSANVGVRFAIVLDNQVISAPVINEPILGGSATINGNFSVQEANNLAILLRAGALPARLTIVEQRTVGASLGEDSIRAGIIATVVATVAIAIFMIVCYGLLGIFAVIALIAQNVLMLAILTMLGATLTLPGIAGIVLSMALAVDSNVLIYERMREEARAGRSTIAALDQGFRRALATIVDAHLTGLIAAIALFWLGSGPIRGFAITLAIGILSTLFTAYLITRLIVVIWYRVARPKAVPL